METKRPTMPVPEAGKSITAWAVMLPTLLRSAATFQRLLLAGAFLRLCPRSSASSGSLGRTSNGDWKRRAGPVGLFGNDCWGAGGKEPSRTHARKQTRS